MQRVLHNVVRRTIDTMSSASDRSVIIRRHMVLVVVDPMWDALAIPLLFPVFVTYFLFVCVFSGKEGEHAEGSAGHHDKMGVS